MHGGERECDERDIRMPMSVSVWTPRRCPLQFLFASLVVTAASKFLGLFVAIGVDSRITNFRAPVAWFEPHLNGVTEQIVVGVGITVAIESEGVALEEHSLPQNRRRGSLAALYH